MSRTKDWLMELEEQAGHRHLAKLLGISYDDLLILKWEIETDESKDGLIYSYRVEFKENSPKNILKKIERLQDTCRVYLEPWELNAEYDYISDQFDAITESRINVTVFKKELDNIYELLHLQKEGDKLKKILNRQVFISIIGTLETFLSETFMILVFDNKFYFQAFVENHPIFKSQKFELRELFQKQKEINEIAKKVILDTIFHNLSTVREMYRNTFAIEFPTINKLSKFVLIRHDLVHRNGKSKSGDEWKIDDELVQDLMKESIGFVDNLSKELKIK